jgi:hypothetical protein
VFIREFNKDQQRWMVHVELDANGKPVLCGAKPDCTPAEVKKPMSVQKLKVTHVTTKLQTKKPPVSHAKPAHRPAQQTVKWLNGQPQPCK